VVIRTDRTGGLLRRYTQPLDTSPVKLTANLSEDKGAVQQRVIERLKADPDGFVNRYRMEFGDHFNPDNEGFLQDAGWPESSAVPLLSPSDLVSGHYRIASLLGRAAWVWSTGPRSWCYRDRWR
jgi:hypothetical protein